MRTYAKHHYRHWGKDKKRLRLCASLRVSITCGAVARTASGSCAARGGHGARVRRAPMPSNNSVSESSHQNLNSI
jgi:hypothetical protein